MTYDHLHVGEAAARGRLESVAAARARLADGVRVPVWFTVVRGVALLAAFLVPGLVVHDRLPQGAVALALLVALVVGGLEEPLLRRRSGLELPHDTTRAFRSSSMPTVWTLALLACGSTLTWVVAERSSLLVGLAVGVVAAALVLAGRALTLAAIRRDIRGGRPVR